MPSSKEVRARQNRQKERVAAQLMQRRQTQRRRRQIGGVVGVLALVIVVAVGIAAGAGNNSKAATPTTTAATAATTTTVAPLTSVKGKPCVGLKDTLPKGSPAMPLVAGPPPTTLVTKDLKVGTGAVVPKNAKVTMNYVGVSCTTGKIFDSTYSRNQTFPADLSPTGQLIAGWQQGIPGMRIGGVRLLSIPSDLGYGASGRAPIIAPDQPLFFLVNAVKLG